MRDRELLRRTADLAADYLDTVDTNRVPATDSYVEARDRFDVPLNDEPTEPLAVVEELVEKAGPGLVGIQSGRKGVAELVEGSCRHARAIAAGLAELPGCTILNDVVLNQGALPLRGRRANAGDPRRRDGRRRGVSVAVHVGQPGSHPRLRLELADERA